MEAEATTMDMKKSSSDRRSPEWIFSPVTFEEFRDIHWNRTSLRVQRSLPSFFYDLLSEEVLDFAVTAASRVPRSVEELKEDESSRPCHSKTQALAALNSGKSLRVNGVQRFAPKVASLCRDLEQLFACSINVNMYLSPGAGKALPVHFDTHDVIVLQLRGAKRWTLFDRPVDQPIEYLPLLRSESLGSMRRNRLRKDSSLQSEIKITEEFTLEAGDFLYVPRGHWHRAQSTEESSSSHLTIGLLMPTYADVLSIALGELSHQDPRLRAYIPLGYATHADAAETVSTKLREIVDDLPLAREAVSSCTMLANMFYRTHSVLSTATLEQSSGDSYPVLRLKTECAIRPGLLCSMELTSEKEMLSFGDKSFEVPASHSEACRWITRKLRFRVSELPGLSDHDKIALATHLSIEGLLFPERPHDLHEQMVPSATSLPVSVKPARGTVEWLEFGSARIDQPFFEQTVTSLQKTGKRCRSSIDQLLACKHDTPPAGFIFHISRCGSTLLASAMGAVADSLVLSEPNVVSECISTFTDTESGQTNFGPLGNDLVRSAIDGLRRRPSDRDRPAIVKFSSWHVLFFDRIREVWPTVPCVFLVRDPAEVAISALREQTGWMGWRARPALASKRLGTPVEKVQHLEPEPYAALVLERFLTAMETHLDDRCIILDYSELTPTRALETARYFGLSPRIDSGSALTSCFSVYSKDAKRVLPFRPDNQEKQSQVGEKLTHDLGLNVYPAYRRLRTRAASAAPVTMLETSSMEESLT